MKREKGANSMDISVQILSQMRLETVDPPNNLRAKVMERAAAIARPKGQTYPTIPRLAPALAVAVLIVAFSVVLGFNGPNGQKDIKAVNNYLANVSRYLNSDASWVEPAGKFGNF